LNAVEYQSEGGVLNLVLRGRLDAFSTGEAWGECERVIREKKPESVRLNASEVSYCDAAGAAFITEMMRIARENKGKAELTGLGAEFEKLVERLGTVPEPEKPVRERASVRAVEEIGRSWVNFEHGLRGRISFFGELATKIVQMIARPHTLRWSDTVLIAEKAGANAIGIIFLMGLLIGLILAFQSAVSMERYGAEIFVADLVAIILFRELGPLITAFIVASRSGSAFAAEIGTMKINEEIDALTTMGLDPVKFLVLPRVAAATMMTPLLTLFNILAGLIGAGIVMLSLGFAPVTIVNQIRGAVTLGDVFGGLAKTFVFGLLIAAIGCMKGVQTGMGASAVGDSATRAVVSSIVAVIVADGVFAVVYYYLGL
jgi:phospholipid/cholesterol/gamma-HCH transport system permease protein